MPKRAQLQNLAKYFREHSHFLDTGKLLENETEFLT